MPARKVSNSYYDGSAARKILPQEEKKTQRKIKVNSAAKRKNAQMVAFILSGFIMAITITIRFSLINEKNLQVQKLVGDLQTISSQVATSQIEVDQNTDLNTIEAYAKQQLGMQKADSSQTVYIDTSESINKVQVNQETTFWDKIISYIKGIFL